MHTALIAREKEFRRSEKAVARADAELREELIRAEKILPSKFLFERNLASDRALEAARNVLIRFQHRFYKLYFGLWWRITLELRLQAQRRAVATIIRIYRGHQCRREARRLRKELAAMQAQKHQLLIFRIKYRSSQAVKLQMVWRRYLRRRAIKHRQARQTAAIWLQRAFRTRQWRSQSRSQSLVTTLANTRKVFAAVIFQKLYRGHRARRQLAESRQRQRQEERVRLALLRGMSKQARAVWTIERRGAGFLIAHRAIFPYAMRLRWHRVYDQLRRQRAAKCISRAVCNWFGVEARREAARVNQINEWLALVQREHDRSRKCAVLIQKHLRRWVQQRKFLMAEAKRKKLARRTRLADKASRMKIKPRASGWLSTPVVSRNSRVAPSNVASPQRARVISILKSTQVKDDISKAVQKSEAAASIIIQCCYRRYCSRKRIQLKTWRNEAYKVEIRVLLRRKAATTIQRRVRGIYGRKLARQRRAERLLLRFILRCKWRRIQKRQRAARKIVRWFKHKRTQRLAKLWHVEKLKREAASVRLQRWYRLRCLLQSRLRRIIQIVRRRDETFVFCDQSLQLCRQHMGDEFIAQSFGFSLEDALRPLLSEVKTARSPTKSKVSPTKQKVVSSSKHSSAVVKFPILQMMFLIASGWKMPFVWRELDGKTIFQSKLDRTKAVTFFRSLNKRGKPVVHQLRQAPVIETVSTASSPTRKTPKLAVKGAKGTETFSSVDVDVAVARATAGAKGALDFAAFVRVLGLLGESSLAQHSPDAYWGRFDGAEARVLALLWHSVLLHSTMQPLALQFEAFIVEELSRHASCLQRLFKRRHNKLQGAAMLVEMKRNLRNQELSRSAVVLQTHTRKLLARRALRRRMQETYEKFLDPTWGLPYWMNPRTEYSTWQKPRILGPEDVRSEPVPFPPPERTLKATCNGKKNCDRCAEWVCYDCDESFCLQCFGEYHKSNIEKRGDTEKNTDEDSPIKQEHELERLLLCGLCKFQLASRRCFDCIPKLETTAKLKAPPHEKLSAKSGKPRTKESAENIDITENSRINSESLFCDVCFGFLHRRGGLKSHRTEPLLELCKSCFSDAEDDKPALSQQQPRSGFSIPGIGDAVQWECKACDDPPVRICGHCALHSHPKESCGELNPVPLQTLGRRQRAKRLREEKETRDRADLDKFRARNLRARQERCARKIQAFWRAQFPIHQARRVIAVRRKEKSEQWLRHQEDARLSKRIAYRAKNALGIAPPLDTDSPVERRLRSLNALARRQLSIRARFFGLLVDEYVTVGIPLPGLGLLHPGSNEIWTSEDLRGWIHKRQTIRFKKLSSQESQPTERALCAWRQLERWGKTDVDSSTPENRKKGFEFETQPVSSPQHEGTDLIWIADIHPKQAITESIVHLALPYNPPFPTKTRRRGEEVVEDVPVAMFLVEILLDPKRTVWINHSLAERFWEWKRLKAVGRGERAVQRRQAVVDMKQQQEREEKRQQEDEIKRRRTKIFLKQRQDHEDKRKQQELKRQEEINNNGDTEIPAAVDPYSTEYQWPAETSTWATNQTTTDPYYDYTYYPSASTTDTTAWTGYDGYSTEYPTSYDNQYDPTTMTSSFGLDGGQTGLVDSGNYYTSGDYADGNNESGATNWYGTEYNAYTADYNAAPTDYNVNVNGIDNNGWDSYAEPQATIDPNATYYSDEYANYNTPTASTTMVGTRMQSRKQRSTPTQLTIQMNTPTTTLPINGNKTPLQLIAIPVLRVVPTTATTSMSLSMANIHTTPVKTTTRLLLPMRNGRKCSIHPRSKRTTSIASRTRLHGRSRHNQVEVHMATVTIGH
ncbi:hypothetical protein PHMEG_0006537 [Phytophthora megakarya]|uniref:Probable pectate lyase F n=1 Tax=Phytophthora megakarya TaxID=4795 RepID=A0A225WPJ0_9STRA|nr:hypothetical protein PHMEG_0006537 [Phytophthora megakarya]